jgi:hypothetical protein
MIGPLEPTLARVLTAGTRTTTYALTLGLCATFAFPGSPVSKTLLTIGLAVLLLTPVARVVVSVIGFIRHHDWWFVLYTGTVLALLVGSFIAAFR